jgi:hypothetical protein
MIFPLLPELVSMVTAEGADLNRDPLAQVAAAEDVAAELRQLGDRLVGHFVEQARAGGCSWVQIGASLGMTRQGAQQRYAPQVTSLSFADLFSAGLLGGLTQRAADCLHRAEGHALRFRHEAVSTGHIALGILDDAESTALAVIRSLGAHPDRIRAALEGRLTADSPRRPLPVVREGRPHAAPVIPVGAGARRALDIARSQAGALGPCDTGTEHLLLGVLHAPGAAAEVLAEHGITAGPAAAAVRELTARYLRARE